MPSFGTVRAAVWAAAIVRMSAAVVLLVRPGAFPMRDYDQPVDQAESLQQQILHRPTVFPLAEDELAYDALARSILRGDGYVMERGWVITQSGQPTGYGGALYPLFVAAIYGATGSAFPAVVMVQIVLSVAAVAGMAAVASTLAGPRAALITAWFAPASVCRSE